MAGQRRACNHRFRTVSKQRNIFIRRKCGLVNRGIQATVYRQRKEAQL